MDVKKVWDIVEEDESIMESIHSCVLSSKMGIQKLDEALNRLLTNQNPDLIWIGLGAPKQEIFMHHLLPHINKGLMIGVGAAFNFYSGLDEYKRAPDFMVKLHLEWLFRAFQEPKRIIKRQLKNLLYLPLIIFNELKTKK